MLGFAGEQQQIDSEACKDADDKSAFECLHGLETVNVPDRSQKEIVDDSSLMTVVIGDMESEKHFAGIAADQISGTLPDTFFRFGGGSDGADFIDGNPVAKEPVSSRNQRGF